MTEAFHFVSLSFPRCKTLHSPDAQQHSRVLDVMAALPPRRGLMEVMIDVP